MRTVLVNVPTRKGLFTRRRALAIVAGSAVTVVTMARPAWSFARTRDSDVPAAKPSPLTDERPPFVLSF
jgi:hypothetical protein